jgi:hypothetical protein
MLASLAKGNSDTSDEAKREMTKYSSRSLRIALFQRVTAPLTIFFRPTVLD